MYKLYSYRSKQLFTRNTPTNKWTVNASIGANTTSTKSDYAQFIATHFGLGVSRSFNSNKTVQHALQIQLKFFKERFQGIPFYKLNDQAVLESSKMNQTNTFPMLYIAWAPSIDIVDKKISLHAGIGFNFMFLSSYKRKYNDGTKGSLSLALPPKNFFVNRPELSLGIGFNKTFGKLAFTFKPTYAYNFTVGRANLIPSFHSVSLQLAVKL